MTKPALIVLEANVPAHTVMPALVAGIHDFINHMLFKVVDGRDKLGHDAVAMAYGSVSRLERIR